MLEWFKRDLSGAASIPSPKQVVFLGAQWPFSAHSKNRRVSTCKENYMRSSTPIDLEQEEVDLQG